MSFYKIGTCDYCDEENKILRPSPFMVDMSAMMCEYCWSETKKEYMNSNGEYIPDFDSRKEEYKELISNIIKIIPSYLKPISINAFRHHDNLNGKIIGLEYVTPVGLNKRLCYKIQWYDMEDYVRVSDVEEGIYEIVDTIS
ncbi:hypothetical protein QB607_003105 [Clostridium botulinum]|nr:hypothetical protein [Clostridium botulinum]EKS4395778.1 hypothetical protein [Clostridium botulinum]